MLFLIHPAGSFPWAQASTPPHNPLPPPPPLPLFHLSMSSSFPVVFISVLTVVAILAVQRFPLPPSYNIPATQGALPHQTLSWNRSARGQKYAKYFVLPYFSSKLTNPGPPNECCVNAPSVGSLQCTPSVSLPSFSLSSTPQSNSPRSSPTYHHRTSRPPPWSNPPWPNLVVRAVV